MQEKSEFNQYWYSSKTIDTIINEVKRIGSKRTAFLSTPTLWKAAIHNGIDGDLFDIDQSFKSMSDSEKNRFIHYDFRRPTHVGNYQYDLVIIDPPFITQEVIIAYSQTYKSISQSSDTPLIISSIHENLQVLQSAFGAKIIRPVCYHPCIPSLVYQYTLFVNYDSDHSSFFANENLELNGGHLL